MMKTWFCKHYSTKKSITFLSLKTIRDAMNYIAFYYFSYFAQIHKKFTGLKWNVFTYWVMFIYWHVHIVCNKNIL